MFTELCSTQGLFHMTTVKLHSDHNCKQTDNCLKQGNPFLSYSILQYRVKTEMMENSKYWNIQSILTLTLHWTIRCLAEKTYDKVLVSIIICFKTLAKLNRYATIVKNIEQT